MAHPALHPQVVSLLRQVQAAGDPPFAEGTPDDARRRGAKIREVLPPGPALESVVDVRIPAAHGSVAGRLYAPASPAERTLVVYLHGGGWVMGGIDESEVLCRHLATRASCEVLAVGYRLAPESRFPAAVEDTDAAVRWAGERTGPEGRLILVGDSAGANLATVAARHARDAGVPNIALQILVYPVTSHRMDYPSYQEHGQGYLLGRDEMAWFWNHYADPADRSSPDASPLLAVDLSGLPPALVLVAEHDPLRDEVLAYATQLGQAGVDVEIEHYPDMIHGFFPLIGLLDTADAAMSRVSEAIRAVTTSPADATPAT